MNLLRVVARPLLAAPFIADGVDALMHPRFHVERAAGVRPLIDKATAAAASSTPGPCPDPTPATAPS